jgi:hypothetical protein
MKLYNQNIGIVGKYTIINTVNGTLYVNKLTDEQLNSYGYYKVEYGSMPNRRYYITTQTRGVVGSKFVIGYTATERPLDEVKKAMFKDLFERGEQKENEAIVDTGLGFKVEGNNRALQAYTLGAKKGITRVRDENFMPHDVTVPEVNQILTDIEDNLVAIFNIKEAKFDEIYGLPTVADCILYEATPEDYIVTQEDVDNDIEGTLIVGQVIVRHKNKVKEW